MRLIINGQKYDGAEAVVKVEGGKRVLYLKSRKHPEGKLFGPIIESASGRAKQVFVVDVPKTESELVTERMIADARSCRPKLGEWEEEV